MSLNKAIIMGNLGRDPELRYTQSGTPVCSFSIATTEFRNDREGNRQEQTEWHRIVVWSKQAENCSKYLSKGRTVLIEGRIQTRSWEDKATGQTRYATEIVAQNVQFVGGRSNNSGYQQGSQEPSYQQPDSGFGGGAATAAPSQNSFGGHQQPVAGGGDAPNLDEIPF